MDKEKYLDLIHLALKEMDKGNYSESLQKFEKIVQSKLFNILNQKDKLFIRKRFSGIQLSLGYYYEGWINRRYNWIKNIKKFHVIDEQNKSLKYLISLEQIRENEKLLIWNDGGYGDFVYQLRLLKYIKKNIYYKIYTSKMDHLLKDQNIITANAKDFHWHLPLNEIPRIINYNPANHFDFKYNYLIKPSVNFQNYKSYVAVTYKTETSINKSIPFNLLKNLFIKKKETKFLILQNSLNENEKSFFSKFKNVSYVSNLDKNFIFEDTFNIINSVKFVISIDTAVTHIAGYLGKRNYLLLMHPSSFYWGYDKGVSSDYPKHIIIRQEETGEWEGVISKLIVLTN